MKKKVLSLLLVTAMATTLLVGCGGSADAGSGGEDNSYVENGITIDGKMYDYHLDGILDSELEEIIPIIAQQDGESIEKSQTHQGMHICYVIQRQANDCTWWNSILRFLW